MPVLFVDALGVVDLLRDALGQRLRLAAHLQSNDVQIQTKELD